MEETKTTVTKRAGFFADENGALSMRRLMAFLFGLTTIGAVIGNIIIHLQEETDWKVALVTTLVPLVGCVVMLFFTTWGDVATVATAIKK